MALLHSRIGKVFYGVCNSVGGLGTLEKIHCHPSLNHHFKVYKGMIESEIQNELNHVFHS